MLNMRIACVVAVLGAGHGVSIEATRLFITGKKSRRRNPSIDCPTQTMPPIQKVTIATGIRIYIYIYLYVQDAFVCIVLACAISV